MSNWVNRTVEGVVSWCERAARWQSPFSFVSALIPLLLALVFLSDLVFPHADLNFRSVVIWTIVYVVAGIIPLVFGHRYPLWAGIIMVALIEIWSSIFLISAQHAHAEINALLELPVIALYVGWFYPGGIARLFMGLSIIRVGSALVWNPDLGHGLGSAPIMVSYAVLIAVFCFEGARAVRRQGQLESFTDPLTHALNRRGLVGAERELRRQARRAGEPTAVAVVDFDHFKLLNERGGHSAGDAALRESVAAWNELLGMRGISGKQGGLVCRLGGDEFVLVSRGTAEKLDADLHRLRQVTDYQWSWGVADIADAEELDAAIERADQELYLAKGRR